MLSVASSSWGEGGEGRGREGRGKEERLAFAWFTSYFYDERAGDQYKSISIPESNLVSQMPSLEACVWAIYSASQGLIADVSRSTIHTAPP